MRSLADLWGKVGITGNDKLEMLCIVGWNPSGDIVKDLGILTKFEDLPQEFKLKLRQTDSKDYHFKPFEDY